MSGPHRRRFPLGVLAKGDKYDRNTAGAGPDVVPSLMPGTGRLTCDEVLRRLDDYVDRALSGDDIKRLEQHLADCMACAAAARFESTIIEGVRSRLRKIAVPPGLREAVHACLTADTAYRDDRHDLPSGGS